MNIEPNLLEISDEIPDGTKADLASTFLEIY